MQASTRVIDVPVQQPAIQQEQRLTLDDLTPTEAEIIAVALSKQRVTLLGKDRANGTNWADLADHIVRSIFKRTRGVERPTIRNYAIIEALTVPHTIHVKDADVEWDGDADDWKVTVR